MSGRLSCPISGLHFSTGCVGYPIHFAFSDNAHRWWPHNVRPNYKEWWIKETGSEWGKYYISPTHFDHFIFYTSTATNHQPPKRRSNRNYPISSSHQLSTIKETRYISANNTRRDCPTHAARFRDYGGSSQLLACDWVCLGQRNQPNSSVSIEPSDSDSPFSTIYSIINTKSLQHFTPGLATPPIPSILQTW